MHSFGSICKGRIDQGMPGMKIEIEAVVGLRNR